MQKCNDVMIIQAMPFILEYYPISTLEINKNERQNASQTCLKRISTTWVYRASDNKLENILRN